MDTSWKLTVDALGTAACELADDGAGAAPPQIMLHALGRELLALAGRDQDGASARVAARTLLLVAERAVKVSELAVSIGTAGDAPLSPALAGAVHLAQAVATSARLRAQPLLAQLPDEELRANFEQEFASHARQAGELVEKARPTA
jgi:hypothetical protein